MRYLLDTNTCITIINRRPPQVFVRFEGLRYGEVGVSRAELQRRGQPIGALDMLIAAHALALGATLVTNHLDEFRRVPGLVCDNWV